MTNQVVRKSQVERDSAMVIVARTEARACLDKKRVFVGAIAGDWKLKPMRILWRTNLRYNCR